MDANVSNLVGTWKVKSPVFYYAVPGLLSLGVRVVSSALKTCERKEGSFLSQFWSIFCGFPSDPIMRDYWFPFYLGWIEIVSFPILMRTGNWTPIGAWVALKVLPQWKTWNDHRPAFNRFLIGNALVLLMSYLMMRQFVVLI